MDKNHKKALLRLADKLLGEGAYKKIGPVPKHKFWMSYWFATKKGGTGVSQYSFDPIKCKTSACAVGWAMSDPWFKKRGLNFIHDCGEVFGLDAEDLFMPHTYNDKPSAATVAARIRSFVFFEDHKN